MDRLNERILDLLRNPEIGGEVRKANSADEAARVLVELAGKKAEGLDVSAVARAFSQSEQEGLGELTDEELTAVSGGLAASGGPNTGGHTQCCYHCYPR